MVLFSDMVKNNILFGKLGVIDEEVIVVVKVVNVYDFIMNLFEGYDIKVGEWGMKLLGG